MKNYTITVNGKVYDVTVEEAGENTRTASPQTPMKAAPKAAPKAAQPAAAPKAKAAPSGGQGSIKLNAPMPGKILAIKASVGQTVKKGDVVLILEAMKMENEIVAMEDGAIAGFNVSVGDMVEAGDTLATLN